MDCAGGYLAAGDVDVSYSGHGAGHGREVVRGGGPMDVEMKMDPRRVEPSEVQVIKII